jgi:hypothetical protein
MMGMRMRRVGVAGFVVVGIGMRRWMGMEVCRMVGGRRGTRDSEGNRLKGRIGAMLGMLGRVASVLVMIMERIRGGSCSWALCRRRRAFGGVYF